MYIDYKVPVKEGPALRQDGTLVGAGVAVNVHPAASDRQRARHVDPPMALKKQLARRPHLPSNWTEVRKKEKKRPKDSPKIRGKHGLPTWPTGSSVSVLLKVRTR